MPSESFLERPLVTRFAPLTLLVACALVIALERPRLGAKFAEAKVTSDVFVIPPPEQTRTASLGYYSAVADLIYAHVLVASGLHYQEKRRFEFVDKYLDTINYLDPKFRDPYRFADTLLTLQAQPVPFSNYRKARVILERGLKALPYDTELWSTAGQFLAYLAAPKLPEPEAQAWRLDGARMLARACELTSNNQNIPYHCINAATLLNEAGEHAATQRFLERVIQSNDDPQLQALATAALRRYVSVPASDDLKRRMARFNRTWQHDLPFITLAAVSVIGPPTDSARCTGAAQATMPACATSWNDWNTRVARVEADSQP